MLMVGNVEMVAVALMVQAEMEGRAVIALPVKEAMEAMGATVKMVKVGTVVMEEMVLLEAGKEVLVVRDLVVKETMETMEIMEKRNNRD